MNDRQRIESAILPELMRQILFQLKQAQETEEERREFEFIYTQLLDATRAAFEDLDDKRHQQLARRLKREIVELATVLDGASNAKCMMTAYYLLEGLLQDEHISIYDGTPLAEALHKYMAAIDRFFAEEKLDKSAQKTASKLRKRLTDLGYFR